MTIEELCREHAAAHDKREQCKAQLAAAEEELDRIESELAKRLQEAGQESIKYDRWTLAPKVKTDWKVVEGAVHETLTLTVRKRA